MPRTANGRTSGEPDRAEQPQRRRQPLDPDEPGVVLVDRHDLEDRGAVDDPAVVGDLAAVGRVPAGDGHAVGEPELAHPGERLDAAADAPAVLRGAPDLGAEHPLALPGPVGHRRPHLVSGGGHVDGQRDLSHGPTLAPGADNHIRVGWLAASGGGSCGSGGASYTGKPWVSSRSTSGEEAGVPGGRRSAAGSSTTGARQLGLEPRTGPARRRSGASSSVGGVVRGRRARQGAGASYGAGARSGGTAMPR